MTTLTIRVAGLKLTALDKILRRPGIVVQRTITASCANPYGAWAMTANLANRFYGHAHWHVIGGDVQ